MCFILILECLVVGEFSYSCKLEQDLGEKSTATSGEACAKGKSMESHQQVPEPGPSSAFKPEVGSAFKEPEGKKKCSHRS